MPLLLLSTFVVVLSGLLISFFYFSCILPSFSDNKVPSEPGLYLSEDLVYVVPEEFKRSLDLLSVYQKEGETFFYIKKATQDAPFSLKEKEAFWEKMGPYHVQIMFTATTDHSAAAEFTIFSRDKTSPIFKEKQIYTVTGDIFTYASPSYKESYFYLKEGKIFPPDALLEQYGGHYLSPVQHKMRLFLPNKDGTKLFYVEKGEKLHFDEEKGCFCEGTGSIVLILIDYDEAFAHFQLVDSSRIFVRTLDLPFQEETSPPVFLDQIITDIFPRSNHSFFAKIDGTKHLLRVGDWLYRSFFGWKIVKHSEEIKSLLFKMPSSPLIIIDQMYTLESGTEIAYTSFNATRTQKSHKKLFIAGIKQAS